MGWLQLVVHQESIPLSPLQAPGHIITTMITFVIIVTKGLADTCDLVHGRLKLKVELGPSLHSRICDTQYISLHVHSTCASSIHFSTQYHEALFCKRRFNLSAGQKGVGAKQLVRHLLDYW